jgi:hypothetical protein
VGDGGAVGKKVIKDSVVIFMGLDNGLYYAEDEDRERTLPEKDKEDKFLVEGQVQPASCKHARSLVDNCSPLWELLAGVKKVIGGPLARYFRIPCCELSSHCTNLGLPGYRKGMPGDLADIKESIREECTAIACFFIYNDTRQKIIK